MTAKQKKVLKIAAIVTVVIIILILISKKSRAQGSPQVGSVSGGGASAPGPSSTSGGYVGSGGINKSKPLSFGSVGPEVEVLQRMLNQYTGIAPKIAEDGAWGNETQAAMGALGGATPITINQLESLLAADALWNSGGGSSSSTDDLFEDPWFYTPFSFMSWFS